MRQVVTICCVVFIGCVDLFAAVKVNNVLPVTLGDYGLRLDGASVMVSMPGGFSLSSVGEPDLPWKHVFVPEGRFPASASPSVIVLKADTIQLTAPPASTLLPVQTRDGVAASAAAATMRANDNFRVYPAENCRIESATTWRGQFVRSVSWCPFRYFPDENRLVVIRDALIRFPAAGDGSPGLAAADVPVKGYDDLRPVLEDYPPPTTHSAIGDGAWAIQTGAPVDVDYLIITNEVLAAAFRPLAQWRLQQGYRAGIALIDEIVATYPGEDTPAKIRSYLADAYDGGLEFCVLGGDETIVPLRYAYHSYSDTMPDYDRLQICDLYYADLYGDWDTDGDGIYGEYLQDDADFFPEIYVGRLLAAEVEQVAAMVDKIIDYETNPGGGDPAYLTRALFTCSDHMRDWDNGAGQHTAIAEHFPVNFDLDLNSQSENPYGSLPDPQLPEGANFIDYAAEGWGWMTLINHGRADGFVVRAAGLNQYPKSYVWATGSAGDEHGHLSLLPEDHRPGIILTVACDVGGFDMDGPLFDGRWGTNASEVLLQKPAGGAVAVIAYSRWGWVASSYRIISKIVEDAFDPAVPPQIGAAFALAKANFPYYRDQSLGLNLYGDPAMLHWTAQPQIMQADFPARAEANSGSVQFTVRDGSGPLAGATVTAAYDDTVFFAGQTDHEGIANWPDGPQRIGGYEITVTRSGYLPKKGQLIVPIATGIVDDDDAGLPVLTLGQNFPNPFNPSTTIEFVLPETGHTRLEVFDILGHRVTTLVDELLSAGFHEATFDGTDDSGSALASGMYFYRLQAGAKFEFKKMVLLK